jgi:hypothetical protein
MSMGSGNGSKRHFSPRVLSLSNNMAGGGMGANSSAWSAGNSLHAMFMAKRPSLQDSILEVRNIVKHYQNLCKLFNSVK